MSNAPGFAALFYRLKDAFNGAGGCDDLRDLSKMLREYLADNSKRLYKTFYLIIFFNFLYFILITSSSSSFQLFGIPVNDRDIGISIVIISLSYLSFNFIDMQLYDIIISVAYIYTIKITNEKIFKYRIHLLSMPYSFFILNDIMQCHFCDRFTKLFKYFYIAISSILLVGMSLIVIVYSLYNFYSIGGLLINIASAVSIVLSLITSCWVARGIYLVVKINKLPELQQQNLPTASNNNQ